MVEIIFKGPIFPIVPINHTKTNIEPK